MRHLMSLVQVAVLALGVAGAAAADRGRAAPGFVPEDYVNVPMPPGVQVVATELDGNVFADPDGRTLYMWPSKRMRNGYTGETKGTPACYGEKTTVNAGLMSPYPPGLELPDVETRPSCTDMWRPVVAPDGAKPVGAWTVVARKDGVGQWAYNGQPLYTSHFDRRPGDVLGGWSRRGGGATPAVRFPVGPPPNIPAAFSVHTMPLGRLLTTAKDMSVYTYDKDTAARIACDADCTRTWQPILAAESARPVGDWSTVERSPGVRQWAFKGKPLYTHAWDTQRLSLEGGDVPGWRNVYTQRTLSPPDAFTFQESDAGTVLADRRGMTVYIYNCGDDALDQLACDHPDTTQAYRLAMCGAGDQARCLVNWPYVPAAKDGRSVSRLWSVMAIDPGTGRRASAGQADALHVWAYRDRPVYTYAGDRAPGDTDGDGRGEFNAYRNGFKAFWVRDDYFGHAD